MGRLVNDSDCDRRARPPLLQQLVPHCQSKALFAEGLFTTGSVAEANEHMNTLHITVDRPLTHTRTHRQRGKLRREVAGGAFLFALSNC